MEQAGKLSVQSAMQLALSNQSAGRLAKAESVLRDILRVHPDHAPALHTLGVIAQQCGRSEQALVLVHKAIKAGPPEGLYYTNFAEMSRLRGDIENAVLYGNKAIELSPGLATAHSNLGIAYYDRGDLALAERYQRAALQIDAELAPALNNLGSIARDRKDKSAAVALYRQVVEKHPDYIEALSNLGAILTETEEYNEALQFLARAVRINPRYAEAHCNIGTAFIGLENYDKARFAFENALKYRRDYPEANIGLAKIFQEHHQLELAEKYARTALALDAQNAKVHTTLASIVMEAGEASLAEQHINHAIELDPELASAHTLLGTLLLEQGRMSDSETAFERAAELDPDDAIGAHIAMTQVRKTREFDEHFMALQEIDKTRDSLSRKKKMALDFALGKAFDDLKQADRAFPYFLEACNSKRTTFSYSADEQEAYFSTVKKIFSKERIAALAGLGSSDSTPIFILGMPRSGTTLTEQIIASHSMVHGAGELPDMAKVAQQKIEVNSGDFPLNFNGFGKEAIKNCAEKYLEAVKVRVPKDVVGSNLPRNITDKMPANFQYLGLIHLMLPSAKIVHVKRNPVDTCLSCFSKNFNHGQFFSYNLTELGSYYRAYADLMNHWREVLPEGSFYEISYEDLVADKESQTRGLIAYCGLPWEDVCLESHKNERNIRTASVTQVRQPVYTSSVQRWLPYKNYLGPLLNALGDLVPEYQ